MIYEVLLDKFGYDEPIFASEILDLFKQFTKAYVFRLLNKEIEEGKIAKFDQGVYYIPQDTFFGKSCITPEDVARKRYISNKDEIYGFYSGLSLANRFRISDQLPMKLEVISNNESSKCREIMIGNSVFIVKKSRFTITKNNVIAYEILQLFTENDSKEFDNRVMEEINDYMVRFNVTKKDLYEMLPFFPAKTSKRMIETKLLK